MGFRDRGHGNAKPIALRFSLLRLTVCADTLSALQDQILALVDEMYQGTIDRIMGLGDVDLAAAVLSGRLNLSKR